MSSPPVASDNRIFQVKECKVCAAILEGALSVLETRNEEQGDPAESEWWSRSSKRFGTFEFEQVFTRFGCQLHQPFLGSRHQFDTGTLSITAFNGRLNVSLTSEHMTSSGGELLILDDTPASPMSRQGIGMGRRIRSEIDPALIGRWKEYCQQNHGPQCSERLSKTSTSRPSWLIDTKRDCLVPGAAPGASGDMDYVALSYVWGRVETLMTVKSNLRTLQQDGALSSPPIKDKIPRTIRDAIKLVPTLGERYLWVDTLCIVQDDENSKATDIRQMAFIYDGAVVTIVCADGHDANHGLPGFGSQETSQPRTLPRVLTLTEEMSVTLRAGDCISRTHWNGRGWTMQEHMFSHRRIFFLDKSVRWFCRCNIFYEDINLPLNESAALMRAEHDIADKDYFLRAFSSEVPDLTRLGFLVADYNRRQLSFDRDVIAAFASVMNVLQPAFPRGFILGLPVSFFDCALLWTGGYLTVREPSDESDVSCPTWTWAGWKGDLNGMNMWSSGCYLKNPPFNYGTAHYRPFHVIPMLEWFTRASQTAEVIPIAFQNDWYHFKKRYMGAKQDLPDGWSYQEHSKIVGQPGSTGDGVVHVSQMPAHLNITDYIDPENPVLEVDLSTKYFYTHTSLPELRFWHPIPIEDKTQADDKSDMNATGGRYLCARAPQAHLWAARPRFNSALKRARYAQDTDYYAVAMFSTVLCVLVVLRDDQGNEVGVLDMDCSEDYDRMLSAGEQGIACNIVAISKGFDFVHPQPFHSEVYTFYNVMWVVWADGIAYRRGVGRVKKRAWEDDKLDKAIIDLVIG